MFLLKTQELTQRGEDSSEDGRKWRLYAPTITLLPARLLSLARAEMSAKAPDLKLPR